MFVDSLIQQILMACLTVRALCSTDGCGWTGRDEWEEEAGARFLGGRRGVLVRFARVRTLHCQVWVGGTEGVVWKKSW